MPLNSVWFSGYTILLFNMLNRLSFWTAKPYKELKVGDAWSRCTNNVISKKSNSPFMLVKHFFFPQQNKTNQSWESRSLILNRVAKRTLFIVNRVRARGDSHMKGAGMLVVNFE